MAQMYIISGFIDAIAIAPDGYGEYDVIDVIYAEQGIEEVDRSDYPVNIVESAPYPFGNAINSVRVYVN